MTPRLRIGLLLAAFAAVVMAFAAQPGRAQAAPMAFASSGDAGFDAWRAEFAARAVAQGRPSRVVESVLAGLRYEAAVVAADQNQPEFVRPVWDYIERATSPQRIARGAQRRAEHDLAFAAVESAFGVDAEVIAAIWGVETSYGAANLPHDAAQAIATLAYEGRRRAQFEGHLLALIDMVAAGYAERGELKSSWAGALGQSQFMPNVYLEYAVDFDGDGRRDIWETPIDVFASIANYLAKSGWRAGEPVFTEVRLPAGFDYASANGRMRAMADWIALGVRGIDGAELAGIRADQAELQLPAGAQGPALLVHHNFRVIRTYNPSDRYALAVALIARGIEGEPGLIAAWPKAQGTLDKAQTSELQTLLNAMGHNAGPADGVFGAGTRAGVRSFQQSQGLPADGWPTAELLEVLRARAAVGE